MSKTRTKQQTLPFKVPSRVRVRAVTIRAGYSRSQRRSLLKWLNTTGTLIDYDPLWALPWRVKLDSGEYVAFARDNLEALEP